jgi:drug/metabolite transporter (DMT)-like permease
VLASARSLVTRGARTLSRRGWLLFAALGVIWGVPYFFIKVAVADLSPFIVAWGRIVLAALILLPLAWRSGALRNVQSHKGPLVAFGILEFVIPFTAISVGEQWVSSSVAGMMMALVPLSVIAISRFFAVPERLSSLRLAGLAIGLGGVALLVGFGAASGPRGGLGIVCMVLATLGYAAGPLIVERHLGGIAPIAAVSASLAIASVLLLPVAILHFPRVWPAPIALGSVVFLGLVCTAIAMLLMFQLIAEAGAARASVITYINPAVATLLGVLLLHEPLGWSGAAAFALILLGSWLATLGARRAATSAVAGSRDPAS